MLRNIKFIVTETANHVQIKNGDITAGNNINARAIGTGAGNNGRIYIGPNEDNSNGKICIGNSCITEKHIKMLNGTDDFFITSSKHDNKFLDANSGGRGNGVYVNSSTPDEAIKSNNPHFLWKLRTA